MEHRQWIVLVLIVLTAGCIRFGEDAVGDYKEGQYKEWLDFRFHTLVVQDVDLAFEGDEVVAFVKVENIGNATPGVDASWAFLSTSFWSNDVQLSSAEHHGRVSLTLTGETRDKGSPRFYTSEAAEKRGMQQVRRYQPTFIPGEQVVFELAASANSQQRGADRLWSVVVDVQSTGRLADPRASTSDDAWFSGCKSADVEEFYGRWNGMRCGVDDRCGTSLAFFQECPERPVQAKYYGDPDDEGIPPGPAWLES